MRWSLANTDRHGAWQWEQMAHKQLCEHGIHMCVFINACLIYKVCSHPHTHTHNCLSGIAGKSQGSSGFAAVELAKQHQILLISENGPLAWAVGL